MLITVKRHTFTENSTIGLLSIDGVPYCATLEDKVRAANEVKIFGETAIPAGTYGVIVDHSNRFTMLEGHDVNLPLLLNVPGFGGVRIHWGNDAKATEGCLLVGVYDKTHADWISNSRIAFANIFPKIQAAYAAKQTILITIS